MPLDPASIPSIAHLARLHLSGDDVRRYAGELSAILAFIEQMNTIDTRGVIPMAHPLDMTQPLRADVVTEHERRDEYQAIAPTTTSEPHDQAVRDGLYIVPKVIE